MSVGKTGDSYKDSVYIFYASTCIWHCISVFHSVPFSVPRFSNTLLNFNLAEYCGPGTLNFNLEEYCGPETFNLNLEEYCGPEI